MTETLTKDDLDIFRGEHPDTRPASEWWRITQAKIQRLKPIQQKPLFELKVCEVCGKNFTSNLSYAVVCSKSCRQIHRMQYTKEYNEKRRAQTPEYKKVCKMCRIAFTTKLSYKKTCSDECSIKLRRLNSTLWGAAKRLKAN